VSADALKDALSKTVGRNVQVVTKVDPSILGGLIVRVGSRMVDSSIKSKLQRLKLVLKGVG
jgi:F-type H+-transporting ATPase subunit delta